MDWRTGRYTAETNGQGPRWRAVIAGDWAPRLGYSKLLIEQPEGCYGDLLPILRDNDLRIVNVETVLGDEGSPIPKNGPPIKGDPAAIAALTAVPWDVATLCNNHVFDYGPEGLEATLRRLREAGLKTVGAGMTQAEAEATLHLTVKGIPVAIVDCGEGEENRCKDGGAGVSGFDEERLAARVRDLRQTGNVVIVVVHAGREYVPLPPPYIHDWYHRLADAGAHLIVGGHPHVPQGVEIRNGCPVCYSTGNFLFWMESPPKVRQGYVVRAAFVGRELQGLELVPYEATDRGLRRLTGDGAKTLLEQLARVSEPLGDREKIQDHWDAQADERGPGMLRSCQAQMEAMANDPLGGAENLRNFFDTPAHRELILTYLRRIMEGRTGITADWAAELIDLWKR